MAAGTQHGSEIHQEALLRVETEAEAWPSSQTACWGALGTQCLREGIVLRAGAASSRAPRAVWALGVRT